MSLTTSMSTMSNVVSNVDDRDIQPAAGYFPGAGLVSPLVLADRLLTLAQDADRAGFTRPAARLLKLAYAVCNEKPH